MLDGMTTSAAISVAPIRVPDGRIAPRIASVRLEHDRDARASAAPSRDSRRSNVCGVSRNAYEAVGEHVGDVSA